MVFSNKVLGPMTQFAPMTVLPRRMRARQDHCAGCNLNFGVNKNLVADELHTVLQVLFKSFFKGRFGGKVFGFTLRT